MKNVIEANSSQTRPAGAWARFWAFTIDGIIVVVPSILLYYFTIVPAMLNNKIAEANNLQIIYGIFVFLISLVYEVYLTVNNGATWGKAVCGLKVVKYKTTHYINYKTAFIRYLFKTAYGFIPIIGPITSYIMLFINVFIIIFTKEKRTIHDRVAGTQVTKSANSLPMRKKSIIIFSIIILTLIMLYLTISIQYS